MHRHIANDVAIINRCEQSHLLIIIETIKQKNSTIYLKRKMVKCEEPLMISRELCFLAWEWIQEVEIVFRKNKPSLNHRHHHHHHHHLYHYLLHHRLHHHLHHHHHHHHHQHHHLLYFLIRFYLRKENLQHYQFQCLPRMIFSLQVLYNIIKW